jgi:hypothetical protein
MTYSYISVNSVCDQHDRCDGWLSVCTANHLSYNIDYGTTRKWEEGEEGEGDKHIDNTMADDGNEHLCQQEQMEQTTCC